MTQTNATKIALERDQFLCQYHLHILHKVRHIFNDFVWGYHPAMAGGHHVAGRGRLDVPEAIIALCAECHWKVTNAKITKIEMVALASKVSGVDLHHTYRSLFKWSDEEWQKHFTQAERDQRKN